MSGPVVLHGGGEFMTGDEPFLEALLDLARRRIGAYQAIRVAVVPTAAARWDPARSAAHGVAAFERVARAAGWAVTTHAVPVVDAGSAADSAHAATLDAAHLIFFPGGDPDLITTVMRGSRAWAAIRSAHDGGAILGGASAGAMALAPWTWTPDGGAEALGVVGGLYVVPHADAHSWTATVERFGGVAPTHLGILGLAERTAVIADQPGSHPVLWRVVGQGDVRWQAAGDGSTVVLHTGETFRTPAAT